MMPPYRRPGRPPFDPTPALPVDTSAFEAEMRRHNKMKNVVLNTVRYGGIAIVIFIGIVSLLWVWTVHDECEKKGGMIFHGECIKVERIPQV